MAVQDLPGGPGCGGGGGSGSFLHRLVGIMLLFFSDPNGELLRLVTEEMRELWGMATPIALLNFAVFARSTISVACLGRLGSLELSGGALSVGFTNITGYSILFGLASGMEPICSQAFGSKNWDLISLSLQRTILILLTAALPISILWLNLGRLLTALGQDSAITAVAATYALCSLPDLLTNSVFQPLRVYLRSQKITTPLMVCSGVAVLLHIPLNLLFLFVFKLGVPGVAAASVLTNFNMAFGLSAYLFFAGGRKVAWTGWSLAAFDVRQWCPLLKLALPSCLGICLEWWWYELITLVAGYLPEPKVAVATTSIVIQTTSLMYTLPMALGACVSTRVGNELGAGRPCRAKMATMVALGCAAAAGVVNLAWTVAVRERWVRFFSDDEAVVTLACSVLPLIGACELGNCPQTTGCGVLRGTARPSVGARINLLAFYLLGMPVAVGLAFWCGVGFKGLWCGLLAAQVACVACVLMVVQRTDWAEEAKRARKLTSMEMPGRRGATVSAADDDLDSALDDGGGDDMERQALIIV
ncbi:DETOXIFICATION 54 protein [Nymphaea thermarum]|nr:DETOXIFICATION 54 protein [Nymphaea thermarum]